MLVKLDVVLLCTECAEKIRQRYLKHSTKIPLTDCDIWGLNALENNARRCGCSETDTSNDIDKINELAKYHLILRCVHDNDTMYYDIQKKDHGQLFLLGYPSKEYILISNDGRREVLSSWIRTSTLLARKY